MFRVESRPHQTLAQGLPFKIDGGECQGVGQIDAGLLKPLLLPGLRCRVVHFKDAQPGMRIATGKGIEARTQNDVLPRSTLHRPAELIFRVAAARRDECAEKARRETVRSLGISG